MKGCAARQISGMNFARGKIHALVSLFASMAVRSALPNIFRQRFFSGAVLSVASVGIEDEDGAVVAGDLDRLAGGAALVEQVETWLRIVVGNPLADRLPGRLDGIEGLDVEGRVGWWWEVDDALMSLSLHPSGCLAAVYLRCAPVPISLGGGGRIQFLPAGKRCPRLAW